MKVTVESLGMKPSSGVKSYCKEALASPEVPTAGSVLGPTTKGQSSDESNTDYVKILLDPETGFFTSNGAKALHPHKRSNC